MFVKQLGDANFELLEFQLDRNETIKIERGSMVYMQGINLDGKLNGGGLFNAIGRAFSSGESFFMTHATATSNHAKIAVAPKTPGKIVELQLDANRQYRLNDGAFLACSETRPLITR